MQGRRMRLGSIVWSGVVAVATALPSVGVAGAEETPGMPEPAPAMSELTVDAIRARLRKVEDNADLDPALKARVVQACNRAIDSLQAAAEAAARADQHARRAAEAPELHRTILKELSAPAIEAPLDVAPDSSVVQLQQQLTHAETKLAEATKALKDFQDEPKRRADRRIEIPKLADASRQQLQEVDRQLETKPPPDEPAELTAATRLALEARRHAIAAGLASSQQELQFYEATTELLPAQRDRAARRAADVERVVRALRGIVNERRRAEAARQADEARRAAVRAHPVVRKIADENAALAQARQSLAVRIESAARELESIDQTAESLDAQFQKITTRMEKTGANDAIGLLLRKLRGDLPDSGVHASHIRRRAQDVSETYLRLIDFEECRNRLATLDGPMRQILADLPLASTPGERDSLESEVRAMLESQRTYFDALISDTNSHLDKLVELDARERQLIETCARHAAFCDERILWIRSTAALGPDVVASAATSLKWLSDPAGWRDVARALASDARSHPALAALVALVVLASVALRRRLVDRLHEFGIEASRSYATSIVPTARAFAATLLLAAPWPALLAAAGVWLERGEAPSDFVRSMGYGLWTVALALAALEALRQISRRRGLGEAHFGWSLASMQRLRRSLRWTLLPGIALLFVVTSAEAVPGEVARNSLGRMAFVALMAVSAAGAHMLMRPVGGVLDAWYARNPQAWTSRLRRVWHLTALAAPTALSVLACCGYYYTALQLASRLLATLWLGLGLAVVHALLMRWVLLAYRDLAIRRAREKRAAEAAAAPSGVPAAPAAAPEIKLADVNVNTRKLLQLCVAGGLLASLWLAWADVLPALGAFRRIELWTVETSRVAEGAAEAVLETITLADLLLAAVVAAVTVSMNRNLPSFLEITLLKRLPIDAGARYAVSTVLRYAITATGIVVAFGAIGVGWSKVQWLVAAISVGLGFGLQEIFANFVSGLVLLFEQPIRLGDIVSVGDVTGSVTRIRLRATTITDWDMRELVVPNKEFITGRVMNWTLSNTVSRMSIAVGVAYGTDPDVVRRLMLEVATQNPLVLDEPAPHALLDGFGESTLNFVLRVYMPSRDVYLQLRHELLTGLAHSFRSEGIEIAFPHLDIRVDAEAASRVRVAS